MYILKHNSQILLMRYCLHKKNNLLYRMTIDMTCLKTFLVNLAGDQTAVVQELRYLQKESENYQHRLSLVTDKNYEPFIFPY